MKITRLFSTQKPTISELLEITKPSIKLTNQKRQEVITTLENLVRHNDFKKADLECFANIIVVSSRINLFNGRFWNAIGHRITQNLENNSSVDTELSSKILYFYTVYFPYMEEKFFISLQKAIEQNIQNASKRTLCQSIWSLCKLSSPSLQPLTLFEEHIELKKAELNTKDVCQLTISMGYSEKLGGPQLVKTIEDFVKANLLNFNMIELSNLVYGFGIRGIDSDIVDRIHQKALSNLNNMDYKKLTDFAKAFQMFGKNYEDEFLLKLSELSEEKHLKTHAHKKLGIGR